jgi:predicted ArsR family transcriptional regulator
MIPGIRPWNGRPGGRHGKAEQVMTYSWEFAQTPAGRVLRSIQMRGKASIKDLAADLGVTASAVRLHLSQLQASGAIRTDKVREGVGRPYYVYSLTPQAHDLFHKDYGDLARLLLEEVSETQGLDALQDVLERVSVRLANIYRDQVPGHKLAERIRAWAELLDQRGVAAEIERAGEGYVVREYGCLYQNVATENRAVCEMERQVMAHLLGSGVELTQCVLDGHRRCQFTVADEE